MSSMYEFWKNTPDELRQEAAAANELRRDLGTLIAGDEWGAALVQGKSELAWFVYTAKENGADYDWIVKAYGLRSERQAERLYEIGYGQQS